MDAFLDFVHCCTMGSSHSLARIRRTTIYMFDSSNSSSGSSSSHDSGSGGHCNSNSANKCSSSQDATPIVETVLCRIPLLLFFIGNCDVT